MATVSRLSISVTSDTRRAIAGLSALDAQLRRTAGTNQRAAGSTNATTGALRRMNSQIRNSTVNINTFNTVTNNTTNATNRLSRSANTAGGSMGRFEKIMHAVVVSTSAMAPLVPALGAALAGLSSVLISAGASAGVFGLAIAASLKDKKIQSSLDGLKKSFADWGKEVAVFTRTPVSRVLDAVGRSFSKLTPLVAAVAPLANSLSKAFAKWVDTKLDGWVDFLSKDGVGALASFIQIGKNLGTTLGELVKAFSSFGQSILASLSRSSGEMAKWAQKGGFERFMDRTRENMPQVLEFFRALGSAISNLSEVFRILGPHALGLTTIFLKLIGAMDPQILAALVVAFYAARTAMMLYTVTTKYATAAERTYTTVKNAHILAWIRTAAVVTLAYARMVMWYALMGVVRGAMIVATAAQWAWNVAMSANPIGLIVIAIVALIAIIVAIATKTTWFQTAWKYTWTAVKAVFTVTWEAIKQVATTVWNAIVAYFTVAFAVYRAIWSALWNAIKAIWSAGWNAIKAVGEAVWNAIVTYFRTAWNIYTAIWRTGWNAVKAIWQAGWNAIKAVGETVWNAIRAFFTGAWNAFRAAWSAFLNGIRNVWRTVWNAIRTIGQTVWNAVRNFFTGAWNAFRNAFTNFMDAVRGRWNASWTAIREIGQRIWNAIRNFFRGAWSAFRTGITNFMNAVRNIWRTAWAAIRDRVQSVWNTMRDIVRGAWTAMRNGIQSFLDTVRRIWRAAWDAVSDKAKAVWDGIRAAWRNFADRLRGGVRALVDGIKSIWKEIKEIFSKPVKWVIDVVFNGGFVPLWNATAAKLPGLGTMKKVNTAGFAEGGPVRGPGTGTSDSIPARLSSGEFVVRKKAVDKVGVNRLNSINQGNVPGFATGGYVGRAQNTTRTLSSSQGRKPMGFALGGLVPDIDIGGAFDGVRDFVGGGVDFLKGAVSGALGKLVGGFDWVSGVLRGGASVAFGKMWDTMMKPMKELFSKNVGEKNPIGKELLKLPDMWRDQIMSIISGFEEMVGGGNTEEAQKWADSQIGKPYVLGGTGSPGWDCSTFMSAIARVIQGQKPGPWFTTHPFHGGPDSPVKGWKKNEKAPFMIGVTDAGIGHMGGTLNGKDYEATPPRLRSGSSARGANHSMYKWRYGFEPSKNALGGKIPTGQRRSIIEAAMKAAGVPPPGSKDAWLTGMNTLIQRESGWNAGAKNNWDSNAAAGMASQGLAQVIPPTFAAHKVAGMNNITNPVHNVAAAIRYIVSRYGNINNVQQANANKAPKGYANGGITGRGMIKVGERGPELLQLGKTGRVYNNRESEGMLGGQQITIESGAVQVTIEGNVTPEVAQKIGPAMETALRRALEAGVGKK